MTLKTRRPTGAVPWPLILVEGGEKSGKSYAAALLTASKKVGRSLWLDLAEGAADEYGAIPGTRYEIIEHDGSWPSIIGQVEDARDEARRAADAGEPPVVLIVDNMSVEWEMLKDWASERAKQTKSNREKLARDPNAEITVPMNCWNDAASRHRQLMTKLMTFPGIVIITARGDHVAKVDGGKPVEGEKTYRVEGHKTLAFDASCWVRLSRDAKPLVVGARSVHTGVRPGIDPPKTLPDDWTLEWVIFEALKCDPATAHVRDLVELRPADLTPEQIRDELCHPQTDFARVRELYGLIQKHGYDTLTLVNEHGDEEELLRMAKRLGDERHPAGQNGHGPATRPPASQQNASTQNGNDRAPRGGPRAQGQQSQAARQKAPAQPSRAQAGEEDWVRDFYARLHDAPPDALPGLKRDATQAVIAHTITKETFAVVTQAVDDRARQPETAGAPA